METVQQAEKGTATTRHLSIGYLLLLLLFSAFLWIAMRYRRVPMIDDAAIYFRYVDQMVAGHGIVYNYPGPHVYGASSLPYTFVLGLLHFLGVSCERASLLISFSCLAAVCWLIYHALLTRTEIGQTKLPVLFALIPCFFALFTAKEVVWVSQGLETNFHLLLCIVALYLYEVNRQYLSGVMIAIALMNKLDALSILAAIVLYHVFIHRKLPTQLLRATILTFLPWLLFTTIYFGNPLPMSLQAKILHEFATSGHAFLATYLANPWILILGLASVLVSRSSFVRLLAAWFVLYVIQYDIVSKGYPFPWYFVLSDVTIYFLAGITLTLLITKPPVLLIGTAGSENSPVDHPTTMFRIPRYVVGGTMSIVLLWQGWSMLITSKRELKYGRNWAQSIEQDRVDIGLFLRKYADKSESVYSGHGWIQYLSKLKVYDMSGINDPEFVKMTRLGRAKYYVIEHKPTYLVTHKYVPPKEIEQEYTLIAQFTRTAKHTEFGNWNLWARNDSAAIKTLRGTKFPLIFPTSNAQNGQQSNTTQINTALKDTTLKDTTLKDTAPTK